MKYVVCPALVAVWLVAASASGATAADGCVAYGDEKTDFTWRLRPAGWSPTILDIGGAVDPRPIRGWVGWVIGLRSPVPSSTQR